VIRRASQEAAARIATEGAFAHTRSLVVVRPGEEILARHFGSGSIDELADTYSVTKSIVATVAGIALDRGELASLEEPLSAYFGAAPADVTLRHLLTMTAGLETGGAWDIDEVIARRSGWLDWMLTTPRRYAPGSRFAYDNAAAHMLGAAVAAAVGRPLSEYAAELLFEPMGISEFRWPRDPDGRDYGFGHVRLRARDLAKLGLLYLQGGQYGDRRLVSECFVERATHEQSEGGPPEHTAYGYYWWVAREPLPHVFAGGYAGQSVCVVPSLSLVAVTTGDESRLQPGWRSARHALLEALGAASP
jgi:CubicO group peptidase (beta-lactamase class C family)